MSANPWPPYLFLPSVVEYAAPKVIGARDWLRLKILLSPAGGLDPVEARFWLAYKEPRDKDWHTSMDSIELYFCSHWLDLLDMGQVLPFHVRRWTLRKTKDVRTPGIAARIGWRRSSRPGATAPRWNGDVARASKRLSRERAGTQRRYRSAGPQQKRSRLSAGPWGGRARGMLLPREPGFGSGRARQRGCCFRRRSEPQPVEESPTSGNARPRYDGRLSMRGGMMGRR